MNDALLTAVHAQPDEVTGAVALPPAFEIDTVVGLTVKLQAVVPTFSTISFDGALMPHAFLAFMRT